MEGGSKGVGTLGYTEKIFKDGTMPDGDACRPDGTLKDASEMEWLNSPSEANLNLPELSDDGHSLKRSLPRDEEELDGEEESNFESEGPPKIKVSYIFIVFVRPENLPKLRPAKIEPSSGFR
jgi:hypothetical protein